MDRRRPRFSALVDERRLGVTFRKRSTPALSLLMLWCLIFAPSRMAAGAENPAPADQPAGEAVITLCEEMVTMLDKDGKPIRTLSPGDRCRPGDRFRTGNKARLDVTLPDGTHARFSELTTAEFVWLKATGAPKQRNIQFQLLTGDAWVNAAMPYKGEGTVRIFVPRAVMNIAQGICRLTVFSDHSSLVKVYQGHVEVHYYQAPASGPASEGPDRPKADKTAWTHLLETSHQIYIRPDGTSTNPFRFMVKTDENKWVLWNRKQDKKIGAPAE